MACAIDHRLLLERLHYEPATGAFVWKAHHSMPPKWNGRFAGRRAGCLTNGRMVIRVGYDKYFAHRLAWFYVRGEWPPAEIDHINCDPSDNRISNLRPATRTENSANTRRPRHNSSGVKGVAWDKTRRKWMAFCSFGGKFTNLGRFSTREQAAAAYFARASSVNGAFARAG